MKPKSKKKKKEKKLETEEVAHSKNSLAVTKIINNRLVQISIKEVLLLKHHIFKYETKFRLS